MQHIVILTGAGISAESGIRTFRDEGGLWAGHKVEDVATPEGFERNPALVQEFYNGRRRQLNEVQPNSAHKAIAEFAKKWPGEMLLVTQNVDDLHYRAGNNSNLIHMHGELYKARCQSTEKVLTWKEDLTTTLECPECGVKGCLRPHIVWFGEMPLKMEQINAALLDCDLFISIGTSGNVYPAAGFVQIARMAGAHTVELNMEPSSGSFLFAEAHHGPATEVVPKYLQELLEAH